MRKIRFGWDNQRVTYLWPDHPLVLAGQMPLDKAIQQLEDGFDNSHVAASLAKDFSVSLQEATSYVNNLNETIISSGVMSAGVSTYTEFDVTSLNPSNSLAMATINITRSCNLHCAHCYADAGINNYKEMTLEEIDSVIKALGKLICRDPKLLVISGGEPTLEPEKLKTAVISAIHCGLTPRLNTNGVFITDELAKFLADNDVLVQVSIDGIDAKSHALLRKSEDSFFVAVNAVKRLIKQGCRVRISFTVHSLNVDQIPPMICLAEELGAEQLITSSLAVIGRASQEELHPVDHEDEFNLLYNTVKSDRKKQQMTRSTLLAETINAIRSGIRFTYCGTGCCTCCVDSDGNLYPCINMMRDDYRVSNIKDPTDIATIWNESPVLVKLRTLDVSSMNPACTKCAFRYFCGGFCRGETLASGQTINSPYTRCKSWKRGLTRILDFLSETPDLYDFGQVSMEGLHRE